MKPFVLALIRGYQYLLRPLLGANCRFAPSCSDYAHEAISLHGPIKGGWHTYHPGGYDPVPGVSPPSSSRTSPPG